MTPSRASRHSATGGEPTETVAATAGSGAEALDPAVRSAFPFERIRAGQDAFLADAARAIREGKHLLAHAPTGTGKTAVALTAAVEFARREGRLVLDLGHGAERALESGEVTYER